MGTFGQNLKRIRTEKMLSQKELAQLLGVTHFVVSSYERDQRKPKPETIERYAFALGCSVYDLLSEDDIYYKLDSEQKREVTDLANTLHLNEEGIRDTIKLVKEPLGYPNYFSEQQIDISVNGSEISLLNAYNALNEEGQQKAKQYIFDLAQIPQYLKDDSE